MRRENQIYCNSCGKRIVKNIGSQGQDYLHVEKSWGYFSGKDGERHSFDLCEACYDKMRMTFVLDVETEEETELL